MVGKVDKSALTQAQNERAALAKENAQLKKELKEIKSTSKKNLLNDLRKEFSELGLLIKAKTEWGSDELDKILYVL